MKHVYALLIKFIMIAVILEILLNLLTDLTFVQILSVSLTVTLLSYVIGDLMILPLANNTIATLVDAGLALFAIYMFNYFPGYFTITFLDALICTVVIGIGEWVFHKYLAKNVLPSPRKT